MKSGDLVGWCAGQQLRMCVCVPAGWLVCRQAVVHVSVGGRAGRHVCRQAVVYVSGARVQASVQAEIDA